MRRGLSEPQARDLWADHRRWCNEHGKDSGGRLWDTLLDKFIERMKTQTRLDDEDVETAKRLAADREAKARADAEYDAKAVSLGTWLAGLRASLADGELLSPHEAALARAEPPQGHEEAAAWILDTLAAVRTYDGRQPTRPNPCGHPDCGLPAHSWVGLGGRRYSSGRCVDHTPAEDWKTR
jgi:hypothetical protein